MSSDIDPDVPPRIRCEAISPSTSPNNICHRPHCTVLRYSGTGRTNASADDPALLIGLALGHVRQGDGMTGIVPNTIISRLRAHADTGNPASRLLLDWLDRRNGDLVARSSPQQMKRLRYQPRPGRRMIPERRQAGPGSLKKRRPKATPPSGSSAAIIAAKTEAGSMNKLSRLLIRRLERIARREAQRNALANGLLAMKIVEVDGHLLRRYTPAFDTGQMTGNPDRDLAWLGRNFAAYLLPPPKPSDIVVTEDRPVVSPASVASEKGQRDAGDRDASIDHAQRAYAVGLVGRAGRGPLISNLVAALVLARAIEAGRMPFAAIVRAATMSAPVVSLHAPIAGFEQAMRRLIETPGFVPGSPLNGIDGEYVYDDVTFAGSESAGRTYIQFIGQSMGRITGATLQRRLVNATTRDYPVVAISEKADAIPSEITIAADIDLATGWLDYPFVSTMIEAVHGAAGLAALEQWSRAYDAHYLTMDDVVLAFRPGRTASQVIAVLASLTERNRIAVQDGDEDEPGEADARKSSKSKKDTAEKTGSGKDGGGGWKRDEPSGAEVIQPQPWGKGEDDRPKLLVETLSGYGKAKTWALDLKADLADYMVGSLAWSDMSSKLLLYGPPGTGKTVFARALCNSLQVPLVVTSVSTWLQGGHLNDVIAKMDKTFAEARALAPSILFVDEIDGIGKRQPAEREYADYWNTIVNKALELLDGAVKSEGLIIVGATNRPEQIDDAIKRSGRLETHIEIPMPDVATLAEIFLHHLGDDAASLVREIVPDKVEIGATDNDADDIAGKGATQ